MICYCYTAVGTDYALDLALDNLTTNEEISIRHFNKTDFSQMQISSLEEFGELFELL